MHSVVHVNLHCRVASSHLHRPRANVERDVHFKKELDFLIYMRRLAAGVKPCFRITKVASDPKLLSNRARGSSVDSMNPLLWLLRFKPFVLKRIS
jgi:hypothetical protein